MPSRSRMRLRFFCACAGLAIGVAEEASAQGTYTSPFSITLSPDIGDWTSDFATRKSLIDANTSPPKAAWYAPATGYGPYPYGPLNPQLYSAASLGEPAEAAKLMSDRGGVVLNATMNARPAGVAETTWQQQRILAAANDLLQAGTAYQHLHLPNFDPALVPDGNFTWNAVSNGQDLQSSQQILDPSLTEVWANPYAATYGVPAPGIDCTDFTAYVYSLALGIQMHSGTPTQVQFTQGTVPAPHVLATATVLDTAGNLIQPEFKYGPNYGTMTVNGTGSLDALESWCQAGDLLYIGDQNGIFHVVMWLGESFTDASGKVVPLVISSHDNTPAIFDTTALDGNGYPSDGDITGHLPPPGVHILPFDPSNWFYQRFQLAMRVIPTASVPEIDPAGMNAVIGLVVGAFGLLESRRHRVPCRASVRPSSP